MKNGLATLEPKHMKLWLKRFRKALTDKRRPDGSETTIRIFYVGEYGDETFRPHYHAAVFGYPSCRYLRTRNHRSACCDVCELVRTTWGKGRVEVGTLEAASAGYVAGYVTKKMTRFDDPRLQGRNPEFSRQSNQNGGLGYQMAEAAAEQIKKLGLDREESFVDVPTTLRHGSVEKPLGRYLRRRMRSVIWGCPDAPPQAMEKLSADMQDMREAARNSSDAPTLKWQVLKENQTAVASAKARAKIKQRKRSL